MEPSIYIDNEFFQVLDTFKEKFLFAEFTENKELINYERLKRTLFKSKIICNINDKELIRLFKKTGSATFVPGNWFEALVTKAQKEEKFQRKELDLNSTRSIFLLNKTKEEVDDLVDNFNIICEGIEYDFAKDICYETLAGVLVDKEMNGCEKFHHKTKNVIIIDPYIFDDASEKLEPKIPNVIRLLKVFELHNKNVNAHLSIITNNLNNNTLFERKMKEINDGLKNPKLTISVFAHKDKIFQQNRHIITDYFFMDLQHVFDRDNGSISGAFLFDNSDNFLRSKHLLQKIKNEYINQSEKTGLVVNKYGDLMLNGIFKDIV